MHALNVSVPSAFSVKNHLYILFILDWKSSIAHSHARQDTNISRYQKICPNLSEKSSISHKNLWRLNIGWMLENFLAVVTTQYHDTLGRETSFKHGISRIPVFLQALLFIKSLWTIFLTTNVQFFLHHKLYNLEYIC